MGIVYVLQAWQRGGQGVIESDPYTVVATIVKKNRGVPGSLAGNTLSWPCVTNMETYTDVIHART